MDSPLFAHGTSLERPRAPGSLSYRGLGFQTPYRACPEVPRTVSDVRVSSAGSRQARGAIRRLFTPGTRVTRLAPSSHAIRLAGPPPASRRFGRVAYCLAGSWVAVW